MSSNLRTKRPPSKRHITKRPIKRIVKRVVKHSTKRVMKKGPLKRSQDFSDYERPRAPPSLEKMTNVDLNRDGSIDGSSSRGHISHSKYGPKQPSDITEIDTMVKNLRRRSTPFKQDTDSRTTFEVGDVENTLRRDRYYEMGTRAGTIINRLKSREARGLYDASGVVEKSPGHTGFREMHVRDRMLGSRIGKSTEYKRQPDMSGISSNVRSRSPYMDDGSGHLALDTARRRRSTEDHTAMLRKQPIHRKKSTSGLKSHAKNKRRSHHD